MRDFGYSSYAFFCYQVEQASRVSPETVATQEHLEQLALLVHLDQPDFGVLMEIQVSRDLLEILGLRGKSAPQARSDKLAYKVCVELTANPVKLDSLGVQDLVDFLEIRESLEPRVLLEKAEHQEIRALSDQTVFQDSLVPLVHQDSLVNWDV